MSEEKKFQICVIETTDIVPRRNPSFPVIFVTKTEVIRQSPILTKSIRPRIARLGFINYRTDIAEPSNALSEKAANKLRESLANRLAVLGFTVNPVPGAEYRVYVLSLRSKDPGLRRVYVGQTSKEVDQRISDHLSGKNASRKVLRDYIERLPELEPVEKFYSKYDAEAEETALGQRLIDEGYAVVGPQNLQPRKIAFD